MPAPAIQPAALGAGETYSFSRVAKAVPDEWYTGVGQPHVAYDPNNVPTTTTGLPAQPKVNQDYVWAMVESKGRMFFSSSGNVLTQASGVIGFAGTEGYTDPLYVAEGAQSQNPLVPSEFRAFLGDFRPPKMYYKDSSVAAGYVDITPNDALLNETLGLRSLGAANNVVLFAGPNLLGLGINMFAYSFDGTTLRYLGSREIRQYCDIRSWVSVKGTNGSEQLYTGVLRTFSTSGAGAVLRWTGSTTNPFSFEEKASLDLSGANLAVHNNRLYVSTWSLQYGTAMSYLGYRSTALPGIWRSPTIDTRTGLLQTGSWKKVWDVSQYDVDPVVAHSIGMGAMASFDGYLYFGTMQVPGTQTVLLQEKYPNYAGSPSGGERPTALFRCKDFDTQPVQLLFGDTQLDKFTPPPDGSTSAGMWTKVNNNVGGVGKGTQALFGPAGMETYNYYDWSMAVDKVHNRLFFGTFDVTTLAARSYYYQQGTGKPEDIEKLDTESWMGADLWEFFPDKNGQPVAPFPVTKTGAGNPLNHGIRNMVFGTDGKLYLGMANASNLLFQTSDPRYKAALNTGGWEIVRLDLNNSGATQPGFDLVQTVPLNERAATNTVVGTFAVTGGQPGPYTFSLLDNAVGRFQIGADGSLQVGKRGSRLDYETYGSYDIVVAMTAGDGKTYVKGLNIAVADVDDAPSNIALSSIWITENSPAGTVVGTVSSTDFDPGDTATTYALTSDGGGRFELNASNQLVLKAGAVLDYDAITNSTHYISITIRAYDTHSTSSAPLYASQTIRVSVLSAHDYAAPTAITLSAAKIAENSAAGTAIGTFSATPPDLDNTYTYTLTNDAGGRFQIVGNQLQVKSPAGLDFEAGTSHVIGVHLVDMNGVAVDGNFTITVTNVNEAPSAASLSAATVAEGSPSDTLVGNLSATDPDAGNVVTYLLQDSAGGRFKLAGSQLLVDQGALIDYEAAKTYNVVVRAKDAAGLYTDTTLAIAVTNVNEAPTGINLSAATVREHSATNTVVGTLSVADPDVGDTAVYTLDDTAGGRFKLNGNQLVVDDGTQLDSAAAASHDVVVRVTDGGGNSITRTFTITVSNAMEMKSMDVQLGSVQRSYIRYVDLYFASGDSAADLLTNSRVQLKRYSLTGTSPATVSLTGKLAASGNRLRFDFGSSGLTTNGYYEILLDLDGNGTREDLHHFYRLLGDVNGDRTVNTTDRNMVSAANGQTGTNLQCDLNGDGRVNLTDRLRVRSASGTLSSSLPLDPTSSPVTATNATVAKKSALQSAATASSTSTAKKTAASKTVPAATVSLQQRLVRGRRR